jgi:hypothetical protein
MSDIRKSDTLDSLSEHSLSRLPPPPKSTRYVQNGKLKIPYQRTSTPDDFDQRSMSRESSYVSRSPSPAPSQSRSNGYDSWRSSRSLSLSKSVGSSGTPPPRRIFPQKYNGEDPLDLHQFYRMEQSPVVFDASLSFVMGCSKQPLKANLRASPAHSEKSTASSYLTDKISSFLKRTDHVMEEWARIGRKNNDRCQSEGPGIGRSRSANNILVRGFQLLKQQPSMRRSSSRERSILIDDDDRTICDEEVSLS